MHSAITKASDQLKHKRISFSAQPGWNDHVYDSHKTARDSFVIWRGIGKPRHGYEFDMMRLSRAQFKYALRSAKQQEGTLRRESLAKKLALSQPNKFWQDIRVMNGNHKSLPSCVGGVSGKDDIADVWREHFVKLCNCIQDNDVNTRMINAEYSADITITFDEVAMAIRKLSSGKSSGLDGIYAEHLLHCSKRFITMLAMCFTGLFVHSFLPYSMLEIVLVPVIKDKTGRIDQVDNYRPIALASVISMVVERILLNRIPGLLETCHNQFGFKQSLGTTPVYMF